jgi:glycosyltransferase involved in cell wall biosynthesis
MGMRAVGSKTSSRPRALVLLTQTYVDGGIQRFNRTFLLACDRLGVACDVCSLADTDDSRTRWTEPSSAKIRVFNHDKVRFALVVSAALLRGGYDFVVIGHVNLLALTAIGVSARPRAGTRVLLIAHGIEVWTGMATWRCKLAIRAVDLILSVSRYTRDTILQQIPQLPEGRFALFPNALSESWVERFQSPAADVPASVPVPFLLSVTRLARGDRDKRLDTVIEALAMLADTSVHYVIAGEGDDADFLRAIAARSGLTDRVHFLGAVSDAKLVSLYRNCSAFVLPSGKEGFGIVFLEAMFFGAPVIAANAKGAVDAVCNEKTGLLVPYGDTSALKTAIERVLADSALCDRLRAAGRASVVAEGPFTFNAYVARLAKVFDVDPPAAARSRSARVTNPGVIARDGTGGA